jgi:hypothetical protein
MNLKLNSINTISREQLISRLAKAYFNVLQAIDLNNTDISSGIKEGLNKFLSNLAIHIQGKYKVTSADYISNNALLQIRHGNTSNLVYEHMIPKQKYIQTPCITRANAGCLTYEYVYNLLFKYWYIAIITRDEDSKLNKLNLRQNMPNNWDFTDIFARYVKANIQLISTNEVNKLL